MPSTDQDRAEALARLYDLDVSADPGDVDLYLALAERVGGPVVELCAGSGRVAVPLALAGHEVTAVDLDPAMLARAGARAAAEGPETSARLRLVHGDLRTVSLVGAGTFRLGIIALNSLLLLGGPRQQREAIAILAGLLAPGGLAVVDTWLPLADDLARYDGRLGLEWVRRNEESGSDVVKTTTAWYDSATRVVTLTSIFDEAAPGGPVRRWIREDALHLVAATELQIHAEDAGLEVEVVAGGYDLEPIEPGDGRAILVARRPPGA
ncbi:MAG: class I SAM-dependent methyltransferase [Candidatus Limnocylindrales bacterium]